MYIVDSHCDSIAEVDKRRYGLVNPYNFSKKYSQLQFVAMFCASPGTSPEEAYQKAVRYVGCFLMALERERDKVVQVKSFSDIERAFASGRHAALLTVEGGIGLHDDLQLFRDFYNIGVRVFGLAWLSNDLAKSNRIAEGEVDTGLTEKGRRLVEEGNRLGMIFDVSHLSDKSFWDLAEISKKPIIASHSNFRALCNHSRNLTDDMAREICRRDGMIGLNLCTSFIHEDKAKRTVESYFAHLEHFLSLFGEDNIGFGGDVDGIDGIYPAPLTEKDSIHDKLVEFMLKHNYSEDLIEKVAYRNYLEYLRKYLI